MRRLAVGLVVGFLFGCTGMAIAEDPKQAKVISAESMYHGYIHFITIETNTGYCYFTTYKHAGDHPQALSCVVAPK
jgi:hypothetical protein